MQRHRIADTSARRSQDAYSGQARQICSSSLSLLVSSSQWPRQRFTLRVALRHPQRNVALARVRQPELARYRRPRAPPARLEPICTPARVRVRPTPPNHVPNRLVRRSRTLLGKQAVLSLDNRHIPREPRIPAPRRFLSQPLRVGHVPAPTPAASAFPTGLFELTQIVENPIGRCPLRRRRPRHFCAFPAVHISPPVPSFCFCPPDGRFLRWDVQGPDAMRWPVAGRHPPRSAWPVECARARRHGLTLQPALALGFGPGAAVEAVPARTTSGHPSGCRRSRGWPMSRAVEAPCVPRVAQEPRIRITVILVNSYLCHFNHLDGFRDHGRAKTQDVVVEPPMLQRTLRAGRMAST